MPLCHCIAWPAGTSSGHLWLLPGRCQWVDHWVGHLRSWWFWYASHPCEQPSYSHSCGLPPSLCTSGSLAPFQFSPSQSIGSLGMKQVMGRWWDLLVACVTIHAITIQQVGSVWCLIG